MISRAMICALLGVVPFLGACAHGYVGIGVHDDRYYHDHDRPVVVREEHPVIVHDDRRPVIVHDDHRDYHQANDRW